MFNLDVTQKCLIAECWCAIADLDKIQLALRRGTVCRTSDTVLTKGRNSKIVVLSSETQRVLCAPYSAICARLLILIDK